MSSPCPFPAGARIVTYGRDSGGEEQDRSVDQQNSVYQTFAAEHQLQIAIAFEDRARPGSTTVNRDGFEAMMAYLRSHGPKTPDGVAGVLLWKLNRFGRNVNDSQFYMADLRRQGFTLHFIADNIPINDEIAPVFEALLAWKAQRDLHDIGVDAKRGLHQLVTMRREDGSYEGFAPGTPPRCYKREPVTIGRKRNNEPRIVSRWVPDPAYWEQGQRAWQMRCDGYSIAAIHKTVALFKSESVYVNFFRNEIYRGVFVFSGERLEGFVPPLCTDDQWLSVQAMRRTHNLADHPERAPRRRRSSYLLSGLLICKTCGKPMKGELSNQHPYYTCSSKTCRKRIPARKADSLVIGLLSNLVLTLDNTKHLYGLWFEQKASRAGERQAQIAEVKKQIVAVNRGIRNLLDLVEAGQGQSVSKRLAEREAELEELKGRLLRMNHAESAEPNLSDRQLQALSQQIREQLATGIPELVKPVLQAFIVKIVADKKGGTVHYTMPLPSQFYAYGAVPPSVREVLGVEFVRWHEPTEREIRIALARKAKVVLREIAREHGISIARVDQILRSIPDLMS